MAIKPEVLYTKPTLYKGSDSSPSWYVEYYFWSDVTLIMERIRKTNDFNRKKLSPTLKDKKDNFKNLLEVITEELNNGFNPFDEVSKAAILKVITPLTLQEANDEFLATGGKLREDTNRVYKSNVRLLLNTLGSDTKINSITNAQIVGALTTLEDSSKDGEWRSSTFNNVKVQWSIFFNFLVDKKYLAINPVKGIKNRKKQTAESHEVFLDEHLVAILQWLDWKSPQTALFCRTIYYTCIRPKELRMLKVKHVNLTTGVIYVSDYIAKNGEGGYINIDSELMPYLKELKLHEHDQEDYLFTPLTDCFVGSVIMSSQTMYQRFQVCLKALNLTGLNYTPYCFKHTSCVKKYLANWTIAEICTANRHKSLAQTEIYLRSLLKTPAISKPVPSIS